MALYLNAPIEDLRLSNRVRNVLRLRGLHTVASLLECDYKTALRGFGPGARAELASALQTNGFEPPAGLNPSEIDDIAVDISRLFGQVEASFQKWSARLEHFEGRIRELTARAGSHQLNRHAAKGAEQGPVLAGAELAQEFKTRLSALRTASAALRKGTKIPADQQEMVALVEQESARLSLLACCLVEMLPANGAQKASLPCGIWSGQLRPHA